jgi:geranylgeranyl reductase family protein
MSVSWDLVVVGAGPAGAAAALGALAARPGARVLLLDRADFPRDKACGDGIAPHALDVLGSIGAPDVAAGFAPVSRLRLGFPDGPHVERSMSRAARVVPRAVLDLRIVRGAQAAGATLSRRYVRSVEERAGCVVVDGELAARTVVVADGAHSRLRRRADPAPVAVAIRGYAPVRPELAGAQVITFARGGWPAYAWSFPVGDGTANIGYGEVRVPGSATSRAVLLERLAELLPGAADGADAWRAHHLPLSTGRPRQPDGRVLYAGDAASLVNPLTGEGIYYAVLSGSLAGRIAVTGAAEGSAAGPRAAGARYRRALASALGRHLRHTAAVSTLARRRSLVSAGLRAAARDGGAFDDLVELGLGRGLVTPRLGGGLVRASLGA